MRHFKTHFLFASKEKLLDPKRPRRSNCRFLHKPVRLPHWAEGRCAPMDGRTEWESGASNETKSEDERSKTGFEIGRETIGGSKVGARERKGRGRKQYIFE